MFRQLAYFTATIVALMARLRLSMAKHLLKLPAFFVASALLSALLVLFTKKMIPHLYGLLWKIQRNMLLYKLHHL